MIFFRISLHPFLSEHIRPNTGKIPAHSCYLAVIIAPRRTLPEYERCAHNSSLLINGMKCKVGSLNKNMGK